MTRKLRLRKADRVRLRLLSERDRDRVVSIADEREQSVSTVLRLLATRFDGDLNAYDRAIDADVERTAKAWRDELTTSEALAKLITQNARTEDR